MNNEVITVIIKSVIAILSVVITTVVIPYVKSKMGEDKFAQLTVYIEYAIRCAEQIYTPDQWAEKKAYVMDYILAKAKEMKIELTENDINILVEGLVNLVKHDKEGK